MTNSLLRISQRPTASLLSTPVSTVTRGTTVVTYTGGLVISSANGLTLVNAKFTLGANPGTGTWSFTCPGLEARDTQIIGTIGVVGTATGQVPALFTTGTGLITPVGTLPEPGTGGVVTIQGMVA